MVRILLIFLAITLSTSLIGQSYLKSAKGTSGIFFKNGLSNLSFDLADSKAAFSFRTERSGSYVHQFSDLEKKEALKEGITLPNYLDFHYIKSQNIFDISFGAFDKGKLDLFVGSVFTPNAEFSYTKSWLSIDKSNPDQLSSNVFYIRPSISFLRRENIESSLTDSTFVKHKQGATNITLSGGWNFNITEDKIFAFSVTAGRMWNTDSDLNKKTICFQENSGVNSSGQVVHVSDCKELPFGELTDLSYLDLRAEYLWRPNSLKRQDRESIGFIGSLSSVLTKNNNASLNFAFGPAVFDKDNPDNIIFSVFLEFIDFNKVNPATESFENIFGIRAYVGLPISKMKTKKTKPSSDGNLGSFIK